METQSNRMLPTKPAAEFCGLQPGTLEVWRCHGRGPKYLKCGAKVLYREADLRAWLESRVVTPNAEPVNA